MIDIDIKDLESATELTPEEMEQVKGGVKLGGGDKGGTTGGTDKGGLTGGSDKSGGSGETDRIVL